MRWAGFVALVAITLTLMSPGDAAAQTSREEELAARQAEKAREIRPYEPTAFERRVDAIQKLFLDPPPVYPFVGSIMQGGLLAAGPGFHGRFGDTGRFDTHAAWSLKNYKLVDGSVVLPEMARGIVTITARATWLDAPEVAFYGIGNRSTRAAKTNFPYRTGTAGASVRVEPWPFVAVGGALDRLDVQRDAVTGSPSFTSANTAGVGAQPAYMRTQLFAEMDWRQSPGYTRRGGLYRANWFDYRDVDDGPYSFRQLDMEVDQFVPLFREHWVIALRALASITETDAGHDVPFFLMPDLGGGSELRGYPAWRFRDRNRLLLSAEYRWIVAQFVDMALFVDTGKVAARRRDLDLDGLHTSYGLGVRFHTPSATVFRVELARTTEGPSLVFAFSPSF